LIQPFIKSNVAILKQRKNDAAKSRLTPLYSLVTLPPPRLYPATRPRIPTIGELSTETATKSDPVTKTERSGHEKERSGRKTHEWVRPETHARVWSETRVFEQREIRLFVTKPRIPTTGELYTETATKSDLATKSDPVTKTERSVHEKGRTGHEKERSGRKTHERFGQKPTHGSGLKPTSGVRGFPDRERSSSLPPDRKLYGGIRLSVAGSGVLWPDPALCGKISLSLSHSQSETRQWSWVCNLVVQWRLTT
jgi:hypothetical protein